MAILTDTALEGFKEYIDRTIDHAQYRIGTAWTKAPIMRRECLKDGRVAVYFSILPMAGSTVTINRVQLIDRGNRVWADKSENIRIEKASQGYLYRFTFDLREESEA